MTRSLFGGILDEAITHGFSQRRPIRSVQIPPELGKSPTDFTNIHRFFLGRFFCHADFADDADFFHRMTRNLFGDFPDEAITHGFSRRRPVRSVQIPPGIGICPTKKNLRHLRNLRDKIIHTKKNLWDKIIHTKKNLRHLRNLRDKNNRSTYRARAIGQRPKFREIP